MIACYLYNTLADAHPTWTLAVFAVSQADADAYVRTHHGSGKRAGQKGQGPVNADCGATTTAAGELLARNHD